MNFFHQHIRISQNGQKARLLLQDHSEYFLRLLP